MVWKKGRFLKSHVLRNGACVVKKSLKKPDPEGAYEFDPHLRIEKFKKDDKEIPLEEG